MGIMSQVLLTNKVDCWSMMFLVLYFLSINLTKVSVTLSVAAKAVQSTVHHILLK